MSIHKTFTQKQLAFMCTQGPKYYAHWCKKKMIMHDNNACMHEKDVNLSNWCKLNRVGFNIVLTWVVWANDIKFNIILKKS